MGSSCSKCSTSVVIPKIVPFDPIPVSTSIPIILKPTRILENCIVLWLVDKPSNRFGSEKKHLNRLFYGLQIFTNSDACLAYIRDTLDEKIFLITSLTHQSVEHFYHLPQLERIYIFDPSPQKDKNRTLPHTIFRNINSLCGQLQQDIELCELDLMYFSVLPVSSREIVSSTILTKEEASFLFIQLSNEILSRFKFESCAKDVFIEFCRIHYAHNEDQLRTIDEFAKHYRSHIAFEWFTKLSFISKIFSRATRTRELDILYKIGFFCKHLKMQLIRLHEENASFLNKISVVYRGKTMLKDEFDELVKNNCGGLLSFSSFLITTTNKENAIHFIHQRLVAHSDRVAIIFEIHIDHAIINEECPFALLKSTDTKNDEICFSPSTVFRIESIEYIADNLTVMWAVKLKLISDDDSQLLRLLTPFQNSELHGNPLSCLGKLLIDMGEYRRAEQSIEILHDTSIQSKPIRLVRVHNGLGANYEHKGQYNEALEHYKKALQVSLTYLPSDHVDLAPMYKAIGDNYFNQKNYIHALQNFTRAMELFENSKQTTKSDIVGELQSLVNKTKQLIELNT